MGLFRRLLAGTPPERREALALALARSTPNSFDPGTDERARLVVSRRRIGVRNMDQLIGMCNMILADGAVDDAEAKLLLNWMEANIYAAQDWPGNVLYERILRAMVDDVIDPDEERELLEVIQQIAGSFPTQQLPPVSGAIPFDDPSPSIAYEGASFVVTGQFVFGTRKVVTGAIEKRGGTVKPACSKKVNYLLVGTIGSEEWLHSTHGTKIVKAVELKRAGSPIAIVREESWVHTL